MDVIELLKQSESKTLEFKRDLSSPKSILRSIIAFANTAGGILILGVEDKSKELCGVEDPLAIEERLASIISDNITPKIIPDIEVVSHRNVYLIIVEIHPSSTRPHYLKKLGEPNGTYIRVGSTNRLADEVVIKELKRLVSDGSFDEQPFMELSSEAIDFRVISELFGRVRKLKRGDLETLNVVTSYQGNKVPTVGGVILFCQQREKYFPDAWIQLGRFLGKTKTNIVDTMEVRSLPVSAIDEVMFFVKKHSMYGLQIPGIDYRAGFGEGSGYGGGSGSGAGNADGSGDGSGRDVSLTRHEGRWNLPLPAIREAIINAVVHADYEQRGAPIRLAIFDDRIEIENPGLLKFGLTIDDIKRGISKLRNRVIGRVFHELGLIERWGSGVKRIIEVCDNFGFDEPIFEEIGTHFRVTIFTEKKTKPKLDEIDKKILETLGQVEGCPTEAIANVIKLSKRATRNRMLALISKGLVVEIGLSPKDPHKKYFLAKK